MTKTTCINAGAPKACPKKTTGMFYVTHPKSPKALLDPLLIHDGAECEHLVMRKLKACLVDSIGELSHYHPVKSGQVMQAFANTDRMGAI